MEKVYEELDELKTENEKLRNDYRNKTELLKDLNKLQTEQLVEIQEARSVIEKQCSEIDEKTREVSELKRVNEDLQRCLKRVNEANEKLRANGEDKFKEFEEERRKLVLALDEASEKNIDMEQRNNVYRGEIEGMKGLLAEAEKKKKEVEKTAKALRESRGRDDVMVKLEEEKSKVEEKLKWKKEQFKHLEEAYEKLQNRFKDNEKERKEERTTLYDEINSLEMKLDSQVRICEDVEKKLKMCNSALSQEESRRKRLEIEVSEFKAKYEDAFAECQDARTQLEDLASKRDEEVAELRQSLCMKEADFKEMKYENRKLEQENRELLDSLKELQEATIQGSGNSALTKLKNKFRNLENAHKNCLVSLRSKEAEWSSQVKKMEDEINDYKLQLQSKEAKLKEVEVELENSHSVIAKTRLQYEEISVMFLVLSESVSEAESRLESVEEIKEDMSSCLVMKQLEEKNTLLVIEVEEERERVACLLKRIEILELFEQENLEMKKEVERCKETVEESCRFQAQMKAKMKEAEKDYEEKLLQVCDALDNTNSDLVAEREKVVDLMRKIESFGVVKEKEIQKHKELLEESEKKLDEVSKDLETANSELFDKTSEVYQLEFQLWVWKSIAKRLKTELEESQSLRKRVEASLLEQVGIGEGMRQEVEVLVEESLRRELEDAVFADITIVELEKKLERSDESVTCFRAELEIKQREVKGLEEERENLVCFIDELEKRMSKLCNEEEEDVVSKIVISSLNTKLETSEESVSCLREERKNLLCFVGDIVNGMSKLCDEDTKMMRRLERNGGNKENDNDSSRLVVMKHHHEEEEGVEEERSPFREINY